MSSSTTKRASTRPTEPKPPSTIHPSALISDTAALVGRCPVSIARNAVIHPRARLSSLHGSVAVGEECMVEEKAVVGMAEAGENDDHEEECDSGEAGAEEEEAGKTRRRLGQRQEGVILERGVVVESGAVVEASVVGAGTVIEVRARIGRGCVIGKHCKIAPTLSIPPYTSLPDHTVVYGPLPTQRRTDRSGTSELRARMNGRHVEVLRVLMADKLVRAV